MYIGVDYYPEHWPEERWEQDAVLMKNAGLNVVRLGEFAWAKLEPEKGRFDFDWLDRAINKLATYGIKVVIGTPTATPPKWIMDESPDAYPRDCYGRIKGFGSRRHYCFNSHSYHVHTKRIVEALANHFKDNENVIAWQIDNELAGRCFCENCREAFISWLKEKYKTIDRLNSEWGTMFWSQTYRDFDEIILPGYTACGTSDANNSVHNSGLELDYRRFSSDSILKYVKFQKDIIRGCGCTQPVTHNIMPNAEHVDYYKMAQKLDFVSWDDYPVSAFDNKPYSWYSMAHSLTRGLKSKKYWVMEQQSGPCGWNTIGSTPKPGQLRLWTFQSVFGGASSILYYRWRASRFGTEQYWYGILDHDGIPRRRYEEIKKTSGELKSLERLFDGKNVSSEVAIVYSYDVLWSHQSQKHNRDFEYKKIIFEYYDALLKNSVNSDIVGTDADFSKYKLIIMPAFSIVTEAMQIKLEKYVKNGGTLLVTFRSGIKTWNNAMTDETLPGALREMAGVELEEFDSLNFGRKVRISGSGIDSEAVIWCDILKLKGAKTVAAYANDYYKDKPAITKHRYGNGLVYYFGCDLDPKGLEISMRQLCCTLGVKLLLPECPFGVETVFWSGENGAFTTLMNNNNYQVTLRINGSFIDEMTQSKVENEMTIEPFGVAVISEIKSIKNGLS